MLFTGFIAPRARRRIATTAADRSGIAHYGGSASPLVNMLRDAFLRAANNKTAPAADKPTEAADTPEVVE